MDGANHPKARALRESRERVVAQLSDAFAHDELPNSFVKRQLDVAPGATAKGARRVVFYLWDQLDLLTGAWPLLAFWVRPTAPLVFGSVALALALHPIVALIGFLLGARKSAR